MPSWLLSAVRTAIQSGWGVAAAWLIAHQVPVPTDVPDWVIVAAAAAATGAWTAAVRWLETRPTTTSWGRLARTLARILMLGIVLQPARYAAQPAVDRYRPDRPELYRRRP